MSEQDKKKELAKLRRKANEIAADIHDIVEERLMTDYNDLPQLAEEAVKACEAFHAFKNQDN